VPEAPLRKTKHSSSKRNILSLSLLSTNFSIRTLGGLVEIEAWLAGCQWLTPIILATQEAEISRIKVQSQPGQIVCETLSRKKPNTKKGLEWLTV
jgi:hypothetical protein